MFRGAVQGRGEYGGWWVMVWSGVWGLGISVVGDFSCVGMDGRVCVCVWILIIDNSCGCRHGAHGGGFGLGVQWVSWGGLSSDRHLIGF